MIGRLEYRPGEITESVVLDIDDIVDDFQDEEAVTSITWSYNNQTVEKDTLLVNNVGTHSITGTVTLSDGTVIENTLEVVIDPSPNQETKHPFYYLKDHLGSTRAVIDVAGNVTESSDYYPFGLQMPGRGFLSGSITTKEGFTGKEQDGETGWQYFGARYYHPALGKFLSVDRFSDKYLSHTPYHYTLNNPVYFIDVNGDSIWYTTSGNTITMHVTGKVMNRSGKDIDMDETISDMTSALESAFSGEVEIGGKTYELTTDIQLSETTSMDDVAASDHLVVLANTTGEPLSPRGVTNKVGGKVIHLSSSDYPTNSWYSLGGSNTRTFAHEFGHAAGLGGHAKKAGNLMRQGGSGIGLTNSQRRAMYFAFLNNHINNGPNFVTAAGQKFPDPYSKGKNITISEFRYADKFRFAK